jgi:hypothetical protein
MALALTAKDSLKPPRALQAAEKLIWLKGTGFTGCGKTHPQRQEVSGHDFSRAASYQKKDGL